VKIFTSYFYQVRFFRPHQIPFSTALYDPKWFHAFKGQSHKFFDRNGVVNGLRCEELHPGKSCEGLCSGKPCAYDPSSCTFLKEYRKQVFSLNKPALMAKLQNACERLQSRLGFTEDPEAILLVHEAPENICSERAVLQDFFGCEEWKKTI